MLTRRNFLNSTLGAGLVLATQRARPMAAQPAQPQRRTIVDSQIHMWKANTPDRPWAPGTRPIRRVRLPHVNLRIDDDAPLLRGLRRRRRRAPRRQRQAGTERAV